MMIFWFHVIPLARDFVCKTTITCIRRYHYVKLLQFFLFKVKALSHTLISCLFILLHSRKIAFVASFSQMYLSFALMILCISFFLFYCYIFSWFTGLFVNLPFYFKYYGSMIIFLYDLPVYALLFKAYVMLILLLIFAFPFLLQKSNFVTLFMQTWSCTILILQVTEFDEY